MIYKTFALPFVFYIALLLFALLEEVWSQHT